ncbi:MAG TPA: hypothetical protein IGS40_05940 [Trichormus sp. M33_DOE_039]|nr:hypothetical protein [Trichormus sp. M33_DOE_039]
MSIRVNSCPCCGGSLLRHVRHGELYWFCLSCRQEVPLLNTNRITNNADTRNTNVVAQSSVSADC